NVAAGEGGLITTDDDDIAHRCRLLRNQGMVERYRYETVGRNLRLTDLQAALAVPQLERLETINDQRRANAAVLLDLLDGTDIGLPIVPGGRRPVWHQFTVLLPAGTDRDAVGLRMREAGVET